jgi:hypothetical protein
MVPLLLFGLLACGPAHRSPGGTTVPTARPERGIARVPIAGLLDVACGSDACLALASDGARRVPIAGGEPTPVAGPDGLSGADTVRATAGPDGHLAWTVEGPCPEGRCARDLDPGAMLDPAAAPASLGAPRALPPPPALEDTEALADADRRFTDAFNAGTRNGWRGGFFRLIVGPGGGRITWMRGMDAAGQLMRIGAGSTSARFPATNTPVSWTGWLALHPTGQEGYLLPWPTTVLTAFDPVTLKAHWSLPLEDAGRGLFLDPAGRWMVVLLGPGESDRFADWPILVPRGDEAEDPLRDEVIRDIPGPEVTSVALVDLAAHRVALRVPGNYRRFLRLSDGRLLVATTQELALFTPEAPPRQP